MFAAASAASSRFICAFDTGLRAGAPSAPAPAAAAAAAAAVAAPVFLVADARSFMSNTLSSQTSITFSMVPLLRPGAARASSTVCSAYASGSSSCASSGEQRPRPSNQFHGAVARLPGWNKSQAKIMCGATEAVVARMIFPPDNLVAARDKHQPDKTEVVWRSDCVEKFAEALKDSALRAVA